jgi:cytochrome c peroxidase
MKATPLRKYAIVVAGIAVAFGFFVAMSVAPTGVQAQTTIIAVPDVAPLPPAPFTDARIVNIGRQMYFDKLLAADGQQGCKLCHDPKLGWAHDKQISPGYPGTMHFRNSQSTINTAFRDGGYLGQTGLWGGLSAAVQYKWSSAYFLARDGRLVVQVWRAFPGYMNMWKEVYGHMPSFPTMRDSLVEFTKTIVSKDVPMDAFIQGNDEAMSAMAKNGLNLFKGKARCILCHNGALLSNEKFHNLMVPKNPIVDIDPLMQVARRFEFRNLATPGNDVWCRGNVPDLVDYQPQPCSQGREPMFDMGHMTVTKDWDDLHKFKTAMLRDVSRTPPYGHNGMMGSSLEEVVEFYNKGGGAMWQPTHVHFAKMVKDPQIKPLGLTTGERADLVAFLDEGLTGSEFVVETVIAFPPPQPRPVQSSLMYETNWTHLKSDKYGKGEAIDTLHGHK